MPTDTPLLTTPPTVARILYKQIVPGDLLKFRAQSNISDSGGGARDLRYGSFKSIKSAVRQMFPHVAQELRSRDGEQVMLDVFRGRFYWQGEDGSEQSCEVDFETPTDARPSEGRLARVHEVPCFSQDQIPSLADGNVVVLLLIQKSDGKVWPHFTNVNSLTHDNWDPRVAQTILTCIAAKRNATHSVIGYKDFMTDQRYCNGKLL